VARGKAYDDVQRDNAVATAVEKGLAEASRTLDIPKSTIKTWAKAAGVNVADEKLQAQVERATTMSVAMRRQRIAETKERVTVLLAAVAELGARAQIDLLKTGQFSLAEAVGATTRAIHDLQLLEGNPTEITEEVDAETLAKIRDELQELVDREQGE
jgi:small-conductance mechanosensitive channel